MYFMCCKTHGIHIAGHCHQAASLRCCMLAVGIEPRPDVPGWAACSATSSAAVRASAGCQKLCTRSMVAAASTPDACTHLDTCSGWPRPALQLHDKACMAGCAPLPRPAVIQGCQQPSILHCAWYAGTARAPYLEGHLMRTQLGSCHSALCNEAGADHQVGCCVACMAGSEEGKAALSHSQPAHQALR